MTIRPKTENFSREGRYEQHLDHEGDLERQHRAAIRRGDIATASRLAAQRQQAVHRAFRAYEGE